MSRRLSSSRPPSKETLPASAVFLTEVSAVEADQSCGMKFWFSRLEGGSGVVKGDQLVSKLLDTEIHNDLRAISRLVDISGPTLQQLCDQVLAGLSSEDRLDIPRMELLTRRLGHLAAFGLYIEPKLREEFETLDIDPAIVLDKDPLWVVAKPDRLLRHKMSGEIIYREYAPLPMGLGTRKWAQSWHYNIRLHVGLAAVEQAGKPAKYGEAMGINQGFRSMTDGRLVHPYVWAYYNKESGEWSHTVTGQKEEERWDLVPSWTYPGGIVNWVRRCGETMAQGQFPVSQPVFLNSRILDEWCASRLHREREIRSLGEVPRTNLNLRSVYFGRSTKECYPSTGEACPFLKACWDSRIGAAPLASGEYVPNMPAEMGEIQS